MTSKRHACDRAVWSKLIDPSHLIATLRQAIDELILCTHNKVRMNANGYNGNNNLLLVVWQLGDAFG